jgi:hypothetical protein
MGILIRVNLPYLGYFFLLYYLLAYTSLPKYIRRAILIYHRCNDNEDIYALDDKPDINEDLDKDLIVLVKEDIKFEDKYLIAFKSFSNDYYFFEEELQEKSDKLDQLKRDYKTSKETSLDDLHFLLSQTEKLVLLDATKSDNLNEGLIKYFDLEDDFKDDPSNFDLDELLNDLKNDHYRFTSELKDLNEDTITETEFSDMALKHVLDKKLDGFINNYILEYTPLGNVYMRYNNFKKSFEYFSNNTIPYRYLEAIGRKYVMTFRCKALFVDLEDEMLKALERDKKEKEKEEKEEKAVNNSVSKFKSYNKDLKMPVRPGSNNNNRELLGKANLAPTNVTGEKQLLKENANRYTWEGRLANFSVLKKVDRKTVDKSYTLSFADFKQMSQIKK